jgi:hypothetical protein
MAIVMTAETAAKLKLSELVDIDGFAQMAGVKPLSIHAYRKPYRKTKKGGQIIRVPVQNPVPEPVAYVGNVPVWTRRQVAKWLAGRPGQGARSDLDGTAA